MLEVHSAEYLEKLRRTVERVFDEQREKDTLQEAVRTGKKLNMDTFQLTRQVIGMPCCIPGALQCSLTALHPALSGAAVLIFFKVDGRVVLRCQPRMATPSPAPSPCTPLCAQPSLCAKPSAM